LAPFARSLASVSSDFANNPSSLSNVIALITAHINRLAT
jgi:hypothetical protein